MLGEVAQERVPAGVAALERPLQLDVEALRPEGAGERGGSVRVADAEPVARAAGEADEPFVQLGEQRRVERGRQQLALLRPRVRVRGGQQPAEVRVPLGRLDEQVTWEPPTSVTSAPVIGLTPTSFAAWASSSEP